LGKEEGKKKKRKNLVQKSTGGARKKTTERKTANVLACLLERSQRQKTIQKNLSGQKKRRGFRIVVENKKFATPIRTNHLLIKGQALGRARGGRREKGNVEGSGPRGRYVHQSSVEPGRHLKKLETEHIIGNCERSWAQKKYGQGRKGGGGFGCLEGLALPHKKRGGDGKKSLGDTKKGRGKRLNSKGRKSTLGK